MKQFRFSAFLTAAAMGLLHMGNFPAAAEDLTYGDLTYTSNGTSITITGCASDAVTVEIPAEIDGLPVTAIGDSAFEFCRSLTSVTMPDSVTDVGSYAFYYCTALTDIALSETLTDMGMYAFSECESLTEIAFPKTTKRLDQGLFSGCDSLTAIHVDENNLWSKSVDGVLYGKIASVDDCDVEMIWLCCYPAAKPDTAFTIPEDVEQIGEYAFDSCQYLTSVTIPASVREIPDNAFFSCNALTEFQVSEDCTAAQDIGGVLFNADGTQLLCYPAGNTAAQYFAPEGTVSLASGAFSDAQYLEYVELPEGITHLEQHLFSGCTSLETLVLPQSIAYIGFYALYGCDKLASIRYGGTEAEWNTIMSATSLNGYDEGNDILDSVTVICADTEVLTYDNLTYEKISDAITITGWVEEAAEVNIPAEIDGIPVTAVGYGAFDFSSTLTSVTLPEGITSIGQAAFSCCSGLTEITFPSTLTEIGDGAFTLCTGLKELTIPEGVTSIGTSAFNNCQNIASVNIPQSMETIEEGAFDFCDALSDVYYNGSESQWNTIEIAEKNSYLENAVLHYAAEVSFSLGDLNADGTVNASDAAVLLTAAAAYGTGGESGLTAEQESAADVNADGTFDARDAALVLQYAAYAGTGGTMTLAEFVADIV